MIGNLDKFHLSRQILCIGTVLIPAQMLTRMVGLIAFGRPDNSVISPKVIKSMFKATYYTFCTLTTPATVTRSMGLLTFPPLSWFLHHRRDNFIIPWQILLTYRDTLIWTILSWHPNPAHLPVPIAIGMCKNSCQPRHRRQLNLPPGRYV